MASAADFLEMAAAAQGAPAAGAGQEPIDLSEIEVEEIPTLDAEEILEEPPPAAAVDAAPPPAPPHLDLSGPPVEPMEAAQSAFLHGGASASFVVGEHRVVVHTVEGQVLRGSLVDVDLDSAEVPLGGGGGVELIPASRIKAIFFMLMPGGKPPQPEGKKVRVTFRDGRQVAGFSGDYDESHTGFFMIPADTRTNTGRIWVYRDATRQVSIT
jgi:small nuclear ribonucleoprotein (snRNP)-like protein